DDSEAAFFVATDETLGDVGVVAGAPYRGRDCAGLFQMWVDPKARGKRVGELLIDAVIAWTKENGHTKLILEVGDDNRSAIRLYERKGFHPTGNTSELDPPRQHITEHERLLEL
ncbi:MAG: GNAT family N-acetyltransferase, partial [Pirellulaceae bacterium]